MKQLRVIFDTNIYGLFIKEAQKNIEFLEASITHDPAFVVYGYPLIRKELKDAQLPLLLAFV